jgi:hypothetical protein
MTALLIKPTITKERPGDLCAQVDDGNLLLPERVAQLLLPLGIRTAVDLLSVLQTFPSEIAYRLGWKQTDVDQALALLKAQLKGRVDEAILNPPHRPEPVYGAVPPPGMKESYPQRWWRRSG